MRSFVPQDVSQLWFGVSIDLCLRANIPKGLFWHFFQIVLIIKSYIFIQIFNMKNKIIFLLLLYSVNCNAQLLVENFNFTGNLYANGYIVHSGLGTNSINVSNSIASLNFNGYAQSGIGYSAIIGNAGGEDVNKTFTSQTNGDVYFSFLCNVNDASTSKSGDYFFHTGNPGGSNWTNFTGRVFCKITNNVVNFGLSNSSTATWGSTPFSKNTTYLLIVKVNASTNNQSLFVFSNTPPALEANANAEVAITVVSPITGGLNAIGIRQGGSSQPSIIMDGITVGTSWTNIMQNQWTGSTDNNWNTANNWSCGTIPAATDNIVIATGTPVLNTDFIVGASGSLFINGSGTLTINPGQKLTLTGAADFGGKLVTVASNASGSGAIVLNGGALTGATNVSLQQWFSAQRAWRMLSNPFTTAITAAAIATNNSSLSVNQSGTGDMVVYTSANDTWAANTTIAANSCYGFFYKGLQSDFNGTPGLSNYSGSGPTATTYTVNGTLNTGSVSVTPYASATYTLVGNPFAAPVNSIALTGGSAAPYYYYQASSASTDIKVKSGAWIAAATNSSNTTTIPMMGLIAYQAPNTNAFSITTAAINTTSSTVASLYKTTAANDQIVVELQKNNTLFDRLIVREEATAVYNTVDANDLLKMDNVVANIYAITPNKEHLAVHTEPSFTQAIPLGISAPIGAYQFKITGAMGASDWYLIDNYLHQQIVLNTQTSYSFDINNDAASAGESRFELAKKMWTTQVGNSAILSSLMLQSNLVQNEIRFKANPTFEKLIYKLLDTRGVLLKEGTLLDANQTIVVDQLAAGMYILQVANAEKQEVFKIVKQ